MDRWLGGALVLAAVVLYFLVLPAEIEMPRFQVGGGAGGVVASPFFFPRFIVGVLGLLAAAIFLRGRTRAEALGDGEGFAFGREQAVRVGGAAAILVSYVALLDVIGYVLLTPVALAALCVFLGYRRWLAVSAIAVVVTVTVYLGFRYGMKILLPDGLLG